MPYILLDRWFSGLAANFVGVNDEIVGAIATEHLIEIGCRQHSPHLRNQREHGAGRLKGYTHTLARHGIPVKPEYIVSADRLDTSASLAGYQAAIKLIAVSPCPTGIFCCNDPVAIGAMTAILDAGLRIPEDVALIGCGNLQFDSSLRVPLSSVDQRSKMTGRRAAHLVLRLVEADDPLRPKAILLEPELVIRSSTRKQSHLPLPRPFLRGGDSQTISEHNTLNLKAT